MMMAGAAGAWNSIVQQALSTSSVAITSRANGYDVTIAIPASAQYAISQNLP